MGIYNHKSWQVASGFGSWLSLALPSCCLLPAGRWPPPFPAPNRWHPGACSVSHASAPAYQLRMRVPDTSRLSNHTNVWVLQASLVSVKDRMGLCKAQKTNTCRAPVPRGLEYFRTHTHSPFVLLPEERVTHSCKGLWESMYFSIARSRGILGQCIFLSEDVAVANLKGFWELS